MQHKRRAEPSRALAAAGRRELATGALPKVEVDRLTVTSDNRTLVAWTHGRGIWKISLAG